MGVLTNLSLFSGVGGLDLGAKWTGRIKTVAYCEFDPYAQGVLMSRIRDGGLDDAPIWDDVSSFPAEQFKGTDIVSGGFPCQDVSSAGKKAGIEVGTRSGLFYELIRICSVIRPRFILLENVAGLLVYPGAHRVFGELARLGYDAGWKIISASDVGAPHQRKRIWIVANTDKKFKSRLPVREKKKISGSGIGCENDGNTTGKGLPDWFKGSVGQPKALTEFERPGGREVERDFCGVAYGVSKRVDRLRCLGNAVVPQQSLPAWEEIVRLNNLTSS